MTYSMCCQRATRLSPVADLDVAGTAPTAGSANGCDQPPHRVRLEDGVAVDHTIRSWRAAAMPALSALALPPLGLPDDPDVGQAQRSATSAVPSVGPVVDDHHLEVRMVARGERPDRRVDALLLVVRRNHHGDRRQKSPDRWGRSRAGVGCRRASTSSTDRPGDRQHRERVMERQLHQAHQQAGRAYEPAHQPCPERAGRTVARMPGGRGVDRARSRCRRCSRGAAVRSIRQAERGHRLARSPPPSCSMTTAP